MLAAGFCARAAAAAEANPTYHPIVPAMADKTVILTGHDLTIEDVIAVARHGAKVAYSPAAIQSAVDGRGLMLEAGAEGIPVYGLNRGAGALREEKAKENFRQIERANSALHGAGFPPEIADEDLVRAILVIRANSVPFETGTPEFMQLLVDLLNKQVTPVAYARGTLGEGDFPAFMNNLEATLVGRGEAYYRGVRMPAAQALKEAGLKPLTTEIGGGTNNAYGDALAALLAADGRAALEWADLIYAMDKLGMNSSLTPLTSPVQAKRPFKWVAWEAARTLDTLKGSYLFADDPKRILQDPESMRAAYIRQGAAWQAWANLRDDVTVQINSGEQNPAVIIGATPQDSWELSTPQMMKYYVKGGPLSHGQHGFVFSNANWDPYPLANQVEAFTNALANMDSAAAQRIERFSDRGPTAFFTGIKPADVLTPEQIRRSPALVEPYFVFMDIWAEIQSLSQSMVAEGNAADIGVADIEAFTRIKGERGRQVVDLTMQLLAYDLWNATYWMDVRKAQDPARAFGEAPTAAWTEFRKTQPWQQEPDARPDIPFALVAYDFLKSHPARGFFPTSDESRGGDGRKLSGKS